LKEKKGVGLSALQRSLIRDSKKPPALKRRVLTRGEETMSITTEKGPGRGRLRGANKRICDIGSFFGGGRASSPAKMQEGRGRRVEVPEVGSGKLRVRRGKSVRAEGKKNRVKKKRWGLLLCGKHRGWREREQTKTDEGNKRRKESGKKPMTRKTTPK